VRQQLRLFDANVLIAASNMYYPLDGVPEFWEWIDHQATNGRIKLPVEVLEEVLAGSRKEDPLLDWMTAHKDVLRLKEKVDPSLVNQVVTEGYAPDLTDDELIEIGQDPFLIAYAIANKPERQNRKIPDVCNHFGVSCQNPFQAYRSLGFSTAWKKT